MMVYFVTFQVGRTHIVDMSQTQYMLNQHPTMYMLNQHPTICDRWVSLVVSR